MIAVTANTKLLTLAEAAEFLRVDYTTVYRYVRTGYRGRKLEALKVGGDYRTTLSEIQRFLGQDPEPDVSRERDMEMERSLEHHRIR